MQLLLKYPNFKNLPQAQQQTATTAGPEQVYIYKGYKSQNGEKLKFIHVESIVIVVSNKCANVDGFRNDVYDH